MSTNLLTLLISVAATFFCCTVGSFLLWGNSALENLFGAVFFASPIFILIFAGFYFLSDKFVTTQADFLKQKGILFDPCYAKEDHENWPKSLKFISYLEVASGFIGSGIVLIGILFTKQPIAINIINLTISLFVFLSGIFLLNKTGKGLKLSLICQFLTMFSIRSAFFNYSSSMIFHFSFSINFGNSSIGVNFLAIIFSAIITKAISNQPNKPINRTKNSFSLEPEGPEVRD